MDGKTLAKIVQLVVQEEVSKIVKKELATMKKQIVAEVKKSIPKQVIKESKRKPVNSEFDSILEDLNTIDEPIQRQNSNKSFSKNAVLNNILNETKGWSTKTDEYDDYPTMGSGPATTGQINGMSDYRAMMEREMGRTPTSTIPQQDIDGRPVGELPSGVTKALTRDYTDLVKAMDKGKGKK
jgi:hypothetical protein